MSLAKPSRRRLLQASCAVGAASILPAFAAWPDKPIRIIVTFPAGGASDIVARVLGGQLAIRIEMGVELDSIRV
jgi:tripartite-type tricarboxylate transporter receptor subunit TctC